MSLTDAAAPPPGSRAGDQGDPHEPAGDPVELLSDEPELVEELLRLAAAAGVELVVRGQVAQCRAPRGPGRLLLVGADAARALARRRHRSALGAARVVLVGRADGDELWRHAVVLGAEQVALLPAARDWLVQTLAATTERLRGGRVVAVVGGCGGAGATVLSVALAAGAAADGAAVLLVDLDPLGGGVDLTAGVDDVAGLRWPDLASASGRLPATSLRESLPRAGSMAVLSWGRGEPLDLPARAVEAVLDAGARGHDLVVVDLPRGADPAAEAALPRVDELLVVVPARVRSVVAAGQVVARWAPCVPVVRAVVRRGTGERWSARRVADVLGVPLAAELRDEPRLDDDLDRGDLPGRRARGGLARAVEQCLAQVAAGRAA